jgi:hypothetical protein
LTSVSWFMVSSLSKTGSKPLDPSLCLLEI